MVEEAMRRKILIELDRIESEEGIRILYACESGSRAWGFPSSDSDYDVRFIYVRDRDWYLRVDTGSQRDVVERPITDLLDINGWDLKKALQLLYKSNPALIEWIHSPIVYRADNRFLEQLKTLAADYYSPRACFYHYAHMARGNNREYLQQREVRIKKYFYVLRPLLAMQWIEQGRGIVPVEFSVLVDKVVKDPTLREAIETLLEQKRRGFEAEYMPRIPVISQFINTEVERLAGKAGALGKPVQDYGALNAFFLSVLRRAVPDL